MDKKNGHGKRVVRDLPARKSENIRGGTIALTFGSVKPEYKPVTNN